MQKEYNLLPLTLLKISLGCFILTLENIRTFRVRVQPCTRSKSMRNFWTHLLWLFLAPPSKKGVYCWFGAHSWGIALLQPQKSSTQKRSNKIKRRWGVANSNLIIQQIQKNNHVTTTDNPRTPPKPKPEGPAKKNKRNSITKGIKGKSPRPARNRP